MNIVNKIIVTFFLLALSSVVFAATPSPLTQVEKVTNSVLAQLKAKKASLKSNPDIVYNIIQKTLLPSVDTEMMSKSVLGRAGWAKASKSQQQEFVEQFTRLMTYTYSSALAKYDDQTIKYFPIRGGYQGKTMVTVNTQVIQPDGPPVNLVYSLTLHGKQWKVYDITVEGISLLESFRQQFSAMLNNQGMNALLANLKAHNKAIAKRNKEAANG